MTYEEIKEKITKGQLIVISRTEIFNKFNLENKTTYVISDIKDHGGVYDVKCDICIWERKYNSKKLKDTLSVQYNTSQTIPKDTFKKFKEYSHKRITKYILDSIERYFQQKINDAMNEYFEERKVVYELVNGVKPYI